MYDLVAYIGNYERRTLCRMLLVCVLQICEYKVDWRLELFILTFFFSYVV